jgi:serine protease
MSQPRKTTALRRGPRVALAAAASLALVTGVTWATIGSASAAVPAPSNSSAASSANNPYSPQYQHPYRHGAIPTISQLAKMNSYSASHNSPAVTGPETLSYGGGIDGIGVQSGHSKVYIVFYGTQWGTSSTDANGNLKFSGDSAGAAGVAQQMFKGIGTNGETWSADLTQWCDGPNVSSGAVVCPSNANFIPYQSGGVLAGVWYDNSAASPGTASGHQLGQEAVNAAAHFGNTTAAANRDSYYVIASPHGTNPDSYQGQYCAWHDYNGDSTLTGGAVSSPYGDIAFSNQPYNIDSGAGCGVGFVNSPGTTDGYSITLGHEWHEMMSDQNPAGGWTNNTGSSFNGQENSDECAWISPGTAGGAANISFGSFGTYSEQASWSNDTNNCAISHAILNHGNTVTVTNPGNQTTTVGTAVSLQIHASDSASGQTLTYSATGLPAGLSISSSGLISGTPSAAGTSSVTVTAKDTTNATGSTSFTWTVNSAGGNTVTVNNPGNQTSTVGSAVSLQITGSDSASGQTLTYSATGLPAGLSISSSGLISGTPTTAATSSVTVTAKDTTNASGSASFSWTVNSSGGGCTAAQLLGNPGFETGSASPWTTTAAVINPNGAGETSHGGTYYAWLDGYGTTHTDTAAQTVTIPSTCKNATFSFWLHIDTAETTTTTAFDTLKVQVLSGSTVLSTLATYSNLNHISGYAQHSFSLASYIGQTITLKFTGSEDSSLQTSFVDDDNALNVS